jgi:hypothetical protein
MLVAHTCNSSYSESRDKEDCGLKLALGKWFVRPYLKNTHRKRAGRVAQAVECLPGK